MNQPKRNLKIWIPIAAVLCFWLGDWMGYTYELTEGTTTHRLADALNLNSLLLHPFRLSADAFSLGCGIAAALMAGLIYLCVKYSKHRLMPQKEYGRLDGAARKILPLFWMKTRRTTCHSRHRKA